MKQKLFVAFKSLIVLVLLGKVLNWILHFEESINNMLNIAMFSLIGIAYLVMAFSWNHYIQKWLIMACGICLILMNFFGRNDLLNAAGIVCILVPMLIARFWAPKEAVNSAE